MPRKSQRYETEWTFSFEGIGEGIGKHINRAVGSWSADEEVKTAHLHEPIGEATFAVLKLDLSIGPAYITVLPENSPNLLEADIRYRGELEFTVTGDKEKTVHLRQRISPSGSFKRAVHTLMKRDELRWDIRINPKVLAHVRIDGGIGLAQIDASSLQLARLDLKGGVGQVKMMLPASEDRYRVHINGGVGSVDIRVPEGAYPKLDIEGGVGPTRINVPFNTATHISVDGNLGGVRVPSHFKAISKGSDFVGSTGVWETTGFAVAKQQLIIDVEGGVGSVQIQNDVTVV